MVTIYHCPGVTRLCTKKEEYLRHLVGSLDVLSLDSNCVRWPNDGEYRTARREVDGVSSVSYI
jgi:hypothetical protein